MARNKAPKAAKPARPKNGKGGIGKFLFSTIMAIIVFIALVVIQSGILSNYETTTVVVSKAEVPKGTDINESNYKEYFKLENLDSKLVAEGTMTDLEKVKDNVTSQVIAKGEVLNQNAIVSIDDIAQNIAGENNDTEDLIVSGFSSGALANSVCGVLRRGDTIDITLIYTDDLGEVNKKILENVYVKNSYDGNGKEIFAGDAETATMFNFLLTKEDDDLLNDIITKGGTIRIRKTNDPEF